jgi:hypothetical protein
MTTGSGGSSYKLITIPGTTRDFIILLENLGTSPRSITLRCEDVNGTFCQYVTFRNSTQTLAVAKNFTYSTVFTLTLPDDVSSQTQLFNIRGKDDLGLEGILTVESTGAGILVATSSKLLANKTIFGYEVSYIIISLFIWIILSIIGSLIFKDSEGKRNIGLSVLIGLVLTVIILFFI